MSRIPHYLHVYEKPARVAGGTADTQHRRLLALNYRHKISAMGGFDTASCDVGVDRAEAETIFGSFVGNRVAVYADNPIVPIWEGFINRVVIQAGGIEISRSLDAMANRVVAQFTDGTLDLEQTAEATDTTSIAIYGSKMKTLDLGEMYTDATAAAEALRDARSAQLAYPVISTVGGGSGGYQVSIEMLGFYHTLTWDTFAVVDTTTVTNAPAEILLDGTGDDYSYNYGIFYDETDTSRITSTTFPINNSRQLGESSWDLLLRIAEMGDDSTRRVVGIAETSPNSGSRAAFYEDANTDIEYTTYAYSDGRIYNLYGQEVNPWDVRPNRGIRINNLLIGKPDASGDGKTAYLTSIDYDAESGQVSWVTDDNVTLEGVMGLTIESRATNERFGAERRDVLINPLPVTRLGVVPSVRCTNSANLSIPDTTVTALTFDTDRWDTETIHSISSNTSRLTCVTAGRYAIGGNVRFASNATGIRMMRIRLNGATDIAFIQHDAAGGGSLIEDINTQYVLAVNDYVELEVQQTSGGALNVLKQNAYSPEFYMTWLGA